MGVALEKGLHKISHVFFYTGLYYASAVTAEVRHVFRINTLLFSLLILVCVLGGLLIINQFLNYRCPVAAGECPEEIEELKE
jgi:hypothetical protein